MTKKKGSQLLLEQFFVQIQLKTKKIKEKRPSSKIVTVFMSKMRSSANLGNTNGRGLFSVPVQKSGSKVLKA